MLFVFVFDGTGSRLPCRRIDPDSQIYHAANVDRWTRAMGPRWDGLSRTRPLIRSWVIDHQTSQSSNRLSTFRKDGTVHGWTLQYHLQPTVTLLPRHHNLAGNNDEEPQNGQTNSPLCRQNLPRCLQWSAWKVSRLHPSHLARQRRYGGFPRNLETPGYGPLSDTLKIAKPGQKTLAELDEYRYDEAVKAFGSEKAGTRSMGVDEVKTLVEWKLYVFFFFKFFSLPHQTSLKLQGLHLPSSCKTSVEGEPQPFLVACEHHLTWARFRYPH